MTDPARQAAEQWLVEQFLAHYKKPYGQAFDAEGQIEWLGFARIAADFAERLAIKYGKDCHARGKIGHATPYDVPWAEATKEGGDG